MCPSKEFYRKLAGEVPKYFCGSGEKATGMTRVRNQESFFAGLGARITLASSAPAALREAPCCCSNRSRPASAKRGRFSRQGRVACYNTWVTEEDLRLKAYVENWKIIGPILEQKRRKALRQVDTKIALSHLEDAFASARFLSRAAKSSGLVEQQAIFAKARR